MTTDNISEPVEIPAAAEVAQDLDNSPGSQLRRAREQAGLTLEELAGRLCMTTNKLEWLERDEYDLLPSAIYVRGYLRNACKELRINAEPLLQAFSGYSAAEEQSRAIVDHVRRGPVVEERRKRGLGGLTLLPLLVVAGVFYWTYGREAAPPEFTANLPAVDAAVVDGAAVEAGAPEMQDASVEREFGAALADAGAVNDVVDSGDVPPAEAGLSGDFALDADTEQAEGVTETEVAASEEVSAAPAVEEVVAAEPAPVVELEPRVTEPAATESADTEVPAPSAEAAEAVTELLQLSFAEESWVEVKDASGAVLLAKLQAAGSSVDLQGQPPFQLMLGNAAVTEVRYQGELVDSAPLGNRRTRRLSVGE